MDKIIKEIEKSADRFFAVPIKDRDRKHFIEVVQKLLSIIKN